MNAQKIFFGKNVEGIVKWLKTKKAKKLLLVTGHNSYVNSGAKDYLLLGLSNFSVVRFYNFKENPTIKDVYKGIEILIEEKCDCCIAVGGGSVMDMAKLICFLSEEKTNNVNLIINNNLKNIQRKIPLIAIPTTAGSGAESTHFAVVYINKKKYSLANNTILPDCVNINSSLSYSLSPYMKAITGIDALSQGIESYWSKKANNESREYSRKAIDLIWNNLKKSVIENDLTAHEKVVEGSNYAGKAINIAKTTAAHAISYYFTTNHSIKHGHAVALTLAKVYKFNREKSLNSSNEIKDIFYDLDNMLHIKDDSKTYIENFIKSLDIELDYKKLNINIESELPFIKSSINLERLNNNPFFITENDFDKLIL